ncbi:MAG: hypothetical protein HLUCCA11_19910 [Phormidesmis priestleyi Ana]|uniref:Uncharacterized protein n=1 Tax=Phormidesmis priestleyi Ana TaxID=1666911 RepID=A0A0P8BH32_9CYAN|nr:MAG: hypothetical protein HLUCCA11_19910 [Phormidesmis priestleyi Ana]
MTIQELLNAAEQLSLSDQVQLASQLMQTAIQKLQASSNETLSSAKTEEAAPSHQVLQESKHSPFEIFQELGLVGCIKDADPHLSRNYKSLVHQEMEDRHNRDRQ